MKNGNSAVNLSTVFRHCGCSKPCDSIPVKFPGQAKSVQYRVFFLQQ